MKRSIEPVSRNASSTQRPPTIAVTPSGVVIEMNGLPSRAEVTVTCRGCAWRMNSCSICEPTCGAPDVACAPEGRSPA